MSPRVVLVGPMGVGKTTVSRILAARWGVEARDTDDDIEAAAGVVAEAMVALVLAEAVLEKFGGDSVGETRRNVASYLDNLRYS